MNNISIGIIGCGNMGGSIARGIAFGDAISSNSVYLYDKDEEKEAALAVETKCGQGDLTQMVRGSDCLVIAVKPQDFEGLFDKIAADIIDKTVISVMAGLTIKTIASKLHSDMPIVRAMPNMAAFVGESMTCFACNDKVEDKTLVMNIFSGLGPVIEVAESQMDAVTALSGSGPAYVFNLAASMINAGEKLGMERGKAASLVEQTIYGAAHLLKESGNDPAELIKKVASKGGTTEAALKVFKERKFDGIVLEAVKNAADRSRELSGGN